MASGSTSEGVGSLSPDQQLDLLIRVGEALDGPIEPLEACLRVVGALAGALGDWCCIHLRLAGDPRALELAALAHRDPLRAGALRQLVEHRPAEELATMAALSVPLRSGGVALGMLTVGWDAPGEQSSRAAEARVAGEIGRQLSTALNASQEAAQRGAAELRLAEVASRGARLLRVTSMLAGLMRVEQVATTVLNHAMVALGAVGGTLSLYNQGTGEFRHVRTERDGASGVSWPGPEGKGQALRRLCLRTGRPVFVSSGGELGHLVPRSEAQALGEAIGDRALVTLPLMSGSSPLGTLLLTFPSGQALGGDDREYLAELAAQTTQALERSLRYQFEHAAAESLQHALLPERIPAIPGLAVAVRYLAASDRLSVGGDWYDIFELPGGRIALVVGDVAGHDLRAAGIMGRMRAQLLACVYEHPSPGAALEALNRLVTRHDGDSMATIVLALWDGAAGVASLALAGHPPPLIVDPCNRGGTGPRCRFAQVWTNPPIGAAPEDLRFEEAIVEIGPGSSLILFSDGLVERRDSALDRRLEELAVVVENCVSPEAAGLEGSTMDGIVGELIDQMLGEGDRNDDVVVLAAHLRARV